MALASSYYFSTFDPLSTVVYRSSYEQQKEALRRGVEDNVEVDTANASVVVAIAAAGLSKMSDQEYRDMGLSGHRRSNVEHWLNIALSALSLAQVRPSLALSLASPLLIIFFIVVSQFPERANLDGIRACLIIASVQLVRLDFLNFLR